MRVVSLESGRAVIVVSERNLIALLNKVRREDSVRTLEFKDHEGNYVSLMAEPDDTHYAHVSRKGAPPGPVVPGDLEEPEGLVDP